MHHKIQAVDKVKEKLKDEVMSKNPSVNYFKILDKDYTEFFKYLTDKKFEIDDTAMENIHEYMQSKDPKVDAALEEVVEPATENILFSKKDTVKNIEKWKPGPNNILFVTGFSGSGKTTLAEDYEKKYNAHMFEIDGIEHGYDSSGKNILERIYKKFPTWKQELAKYKNKTAGFPNDTYDAIIDYLIKICHEDKDTLYIIEGIQIMGPVKDKDPTNFRYINHIKGQPLIIKGTAMLPASIRAANRNISNGGAEFGIKEYKRSIKCNSRIQKSIDSFEKAAEGSLPAEDRTDFGIPSLKKYPMPDAKHVKLAIKFFNYVDKEHEEELARNIKKYAKKYGVELEAGENNRFSNYL
jgi:hypothetical protein